MNEVTQKKRGKLLTFLLILDFVLILWSTLNFIPSVWINYHSIFAKLFVLEGYFEEIITLIGIFFWKRWAVYLFFGGNIIHLFIYEILVHTNSISPGFAITYFSIFLSWIPWIAFTIIWFIAIKRKWNLFR